VGELHIGELPEMETNLQPPAVEVPKTTDGENKDVDTKMEKRELPNALTENGKAERKKPRSPKPRRLRDRLKNRKR
jgi:hypothetical protein